MKKTLLAIFTLACISTLSAADHGTLIFEDDFNRKETQDKVDEVGKGWATNSKARAKNNKQVFLKNGAMYIATHPEADHAASVTHPAEFRDGAVELRFMLEDARDTLGVDFADPQFKDVHAGHLFKVDVGVKRVQVDDLKMGTMNMKFYDQKKAGTLTPEQKDVIASKKKSFPVQLDAGKWYTLLVTIAGDTVSVSIDGKNVGSATSEGFAHPTKRMLRLPVPRHAVVDDVKIYAKPTPSANEK